MARRLIGLVATLTWYSCPTILGCFARCGPLIAVGSTLMPSRLKRLVARSLDVLGVHPNFKTDRYWEKRYATGGNSGLGSQGFNHRFKRDTIERLIRARGIRSVVDFGCGDGRQMFEVLSETTLDEYQGIDISPSAVSLCRERYRGLPHCHFDVAGEAPIGTYDLALSLDVIYHVVEYDTYVDYLKTLFGCSDYVLLYANREARASEVPHIVFRANRAEIESLLPETELLEEEPHPEMSTSFFLFKTSRTSPRAE